MATNDLTSERLREVLSYDPETDTWTRIKAHKMRPDRQGTQAGHWDGGYLNIKIGSVKYKAHRLVWLWHHGKMPTGHVDHINGDTRTNRIENLRDASRSINAQNQQKPHKNNACGFLGVHKFRSKFAAQISVAGVINRIGLFDTAEEAHVAYITAKRALHPGCVL